MTPRFFAELFMLLITLVWVANFVAGLTVTGYQSAPINSIFMVVAGSGILASAIGKTNNGGVST